MQQKWYLSIWFIALVFSFSVLLIPFVVGIVLLVLRHQHDTRFKQELQQSGFGDLLKIQKLKEQTEKDMQARLGQFQQEQAVLEAKKAELLSEINRLEKELTEKKEQVIILDDELLFQSFGFYDPKYAFESSEVYKQKLDQIRERQKKLVKDKRATLHSDTWTLDGSLSKGKSMNNNNIKLTLRSFNNECDTAISKVKFNNIQAIEKRILSAYETLNKVNKHNNIEIREEYLNLKLQELYLAYEYEQKKEEEREEQRRIKEQMREEQRVQQELQRIKEKIEKEETHFKQAIDKLQNQLEKASDKKKEEIEQKLRELEDQLAALEKDKQNVLEREQNTRAGYVYIISNIGSFGEDVFKIGMTRRLEPMDRVKELGDASVPFQFDVHAMIFSEDAPKLENALHRAFHGNRVNKINERKEFFNISLREIESVVVQEHNKVVEFTKLAEAQEYRESQRVAV